MRISYLWEFCSLVAYKNMSTTARRLNVSQQSLSKHLAALEKEVGATLFERRRGSQTLVLTPEGEFLSRQAIEIINLWNKTKVDLSSQTARTQRILINSSRREPFFGLIAQYQRENADGPLSPVSWVQMENIDSLSMVQEGTADIALEPYSPHLSEAANLERVHLFSDPIMLICHEDDPLSLQDTINVLDLKGRRLLSPFQARGVIYGWIPHDLCNPYGFSPKMESLPYDNEESLLIERLNPGHYAAVPQSSLRHLQALLPFARFIPIRDATYDMHAFFNPRNKNPHVAETVHELARLCDRLSEGLAD